MALIFIDGGRHYSTAQIARKWGAASNVAVTDETIRRPGTKALRSSAGTLLSPTFSGLSNTLVVAAAVYHSAANPGYLKILSGTTAQLTLAWTATGVLNVIRGDWNGDILASSEAGVFLFGQWIYLEIDATIHNTSGGVEVRLNGVTVDALSLSGTDTQPGATTGVDRFQISNNGILYVTDVYADSDTLHGDCIVDTTFPTGAGAHTDFSPSTGANWENVDDEGAVDDDATFNASADLNDMDTFVFADLPASATSEIIGIAVNIAARKDDDLTRQLKAVARVSSTDYLHSTVISPTGFFGNAQRIFEDNPADASPWEEADVNGAEFGYKQTLVS